MLPYWLVQVFPDLSIEMLLLWIPVYVAGFVCVPLVLIGRLYGSHAWGFLAACLAGVTHSYYNRTLAGYYDTDMFSITIPAFALYFLLGASRRKSLNYALGAAITLLSLSLFLCLWSGDYWSSGSSLHRLFIWISCLRVFYSVTNEIAKR